MNLIQLCLIDVANLSFDNFELASSRATRENRLQAVFGMLCTDFDQPDLGCTDADLGEPKIFFRIFMRYMKKITLNCWVGTFQFFERLELSTMGY